MFSYGSDNANVAQANSKSLTTLLGDYTIPHNKQFSSKYGIIYKHIAYVGTTQDHRLAPTVRADNQVNLKLGTTYLWEPTRIINTTFDYINNSSNQHAFSYSKMMIGVNLLLVF